MRFGKLELVNLPNYEEKPSKNLCLAVTTLVAISVIHSYVAKAEEPKEETLMSQLKKQENPVTQAQKWMIINDGVMGGLSQSQVSNNSDHLIFSGQLSLRNNGGFASTRRLWSITTEKEVSSVSITVRGDGRQYQLRFRTNQTFDGVSYVTMFPTTSQWQTHTFSKNDFTPRFRGWTVRRAPLFSFNDVQQIGFMIADKREDRFTLEIKDISFTYAH